jgi:hypothetical protein
VQPRLTLTKQTVNLEVHNHNHPLSPPLPAQQQKTNPLPLYSPGKLGKLARRFSCVLAWLGWTRFFNSHHHHNISSLSSTIHHIHHPAGSRLHHLATHGIPTHSASPPWTLQQQDDAVWQGPHSSAPHIYKSFLLEDMNDMVRMGYWEVLPYSVVHGMMYLKLAPSGVVLQRDFCPCPIMDYTYNGVNAATLDVALTHAMKFGSSLQCILQQLAYRNLAYELPLMAKINLADGYNRIPLSPSAALELAVILPPDGSQEPLIGLPLSLPMGWKASPPYFGAFIETCADLSNHRAPPLHNHPFAYAFHQHAAHAVDLPCEPNTILLFNPLPPPEPLQYTDVYIDNFMLLAQKPKQIATMNTLLHHLNTIFHDPKDSPRCSIVLESKVTKGDATFSMAKRLLGWDIQSHDLTI